MAPIIFAREGGLTAVRLRRGRGSILYYNIEMTAENDAPSPKKPGKKAGRHPLSPGKPMTVTITARIDDVTRTKLQALGQGHASEGLRVAADFAYDQWQRGRLTLEPKT